MVGPSTARKKIGVPVAERAKLKQLDAPILNTGLTHHPHDGFHLLKTRQILFKKNFRPNA